MMRAYAETDGCRRGVPPLLLRRAVRAAVRALRQLRRRAGARRRRAERAVRGRRARRAREWGEGVVQRYEDDAVVVLFDEVGYKTLALDVVRERSILSEARSASRPA